MIAGAWVIARNTKRNLDNLGISFGFDFLKNEAGYDISEVVPIPQLEGGFLYFLIALFAGIVVVVFISRHQSAKGKVIGDDLGMVLAAIAVLFVIPGGILLSQSHSIVTVTYTAESNYFTALITGLINTLKVSIIGCILATLLGLVIGISRLSSNWLLSTLAATYIETLRNIPLLLQLFFWYHAVLRTLPGVRDSFNFFDYAFLNNRGIFLPNPNAASGFSPFVIAIFLAGVAIYFRARYARQIRDSTGEQVAVFYPAIGALILLPLLSIFAFGFPLSATFPVLEGFNYEGGLIISPEFAAMLTGLVLYTASFVAEIIRSGIQAIPKGQIEAAQAVGLRDGQVLRLVTLPQALRVIIPPMTSQYLNLTKNSSLGLAIAYADLVSSGDTILNQSGHAIEIIMIYMGVYLTFSLLISIFMNWYNAKSKLVER